MSGEFEGYQESEGAPNNTQYDYTNAPTISAEQSPYDPTITATAYPIDDSSAEAAAAASGIDKLVDKVGKIGVLILINVSSVILLISSGASCFVGGLSCVGVSAYVFSVAIISFLISLIYIILLRHTTALENQEGLHHGMGWFFVVWWIAGSFTATFSAPCCIVTGNGYFASWAGLFGSIMYLKLVSPIVQSKIASGTSALALGNLFGCMLCSIIVLIGASVEEAALHSGIRAYGIAVGAVSVVAVGICSLLARNTSADNAKTFSYIMASLVIWWVIGTLVLTFSAEGFPITGNVYFGCFFGIYFCVLALRDTTLWATILNGAAKAAAGVVANTATEAQEGSYVSATTEPQYVGSDAYATSNTDGMDF
jgi:hypothetical protein